MHWLWEQISGILRQTWLLWLDMGVYLVLGFAIAGILSRLLSQRMIARHLGGKGLGPSLKASLFGVPLPLCSCGVIPVGLSLFRRGASRSSATSFLISTPQTGVDSIAITYAFLGPVFALVRPVAAFLNGVLGGAAVARWGEQGREGEEASGVEAASCADGCGPDVQEERPSASLAEHAREAFRYGFIEFPREIAGLLLLGTLAAGVVAFYLPSGILGKYLGVGLLPMAVMAVAGTPLYICATASVPFVAVLIEKGLSPGAALVFLMCGPATNMATLVMLGRTLGRRTTAVYLVSIVLAAFIFGGLLDAYYRATGGAVRIAEHIHEHELFPEWVNLAGAWALIVICLGVFGHRLLRRFAEGGEEEEAEAEPDRELRVEGMTCQGCAEHVRQALEGVAGVRRALVDHRTGRARIYGRPEDPEALGLAVAAAGYSLGG